MKITDFCLETALYIADEYDYCKIKIKVGSPKYDLDWTELATNGTSHWKTDLGVITIELQDGYCGVFVICYLDGNKDNNEPCCAFENDTNHLVICTLSALENLIKLK